MQSRRSSPRAFFAGAVAAVRSVLVGRPRPPLDEAAVRRPNRPRRRPTVPPPSAAATIGSAVAEALALPIPRRRTRREILTLISAGLVGGAGLIVAVPVVGALLAPLTRPQPPEWRAVGAESNFQIGSTVSVTFEDPSPLSWSGVASQTAAWLRRSSATQFTAFSVNCTHLGCPVRWVPGGRLFLCPCHGGVFYEDGTVAAGPPQHPLYQYPVRVRNGQVEILSSPVPIV